MKSIINGMTCVQCGKIFSHQQPNTKVCSDECRRSRNQLISGRCSFQRGLSSGTMGTISEMVVSVDLFKRGYAVFRALSPSCFCDLIAVKDGKMLRIEVRTGYSRKDGNGSTYFTNKTHGIIDCFGVYVPSKDEVAYFDASGIEINLSPVLT